MEENNNSRLGVIDSLKQDMNNAKDTRHAIVTAYNTTEAILQKNRENEKNIVTGVEQAKTQDMKIDLSEITTLVFRNTKPELIKNDKTPEESQPQR